MTSFYSSEAVFPLSGNTGTILDDHSWTILKEETVIFRHNNNSELNANMATSDSPKPATEVQETAVKRPVDTRSESRQNTSRKDPSLFTCTNISLNVGEYDISDNGTLHVKAFRMTLNSSFYMQKGDTVTICKPTKKVTEVSTLGKLLIAILTFTYSLITMLSAMCSLSKNSTYLKLALVSWICVSSNIFLWTIVILVIPGTETLFSWVSMSVNMNQSIYLTSAWMALLTSNKLLKFLQKFSFVEIAERVVTVKVGRIGVLCSFGAAILAIVNFVLDEVAFVKDEVFNSCLFCNPIIYAVVFAFVLAEWLYGPFEINISPVSRDYREYHFSLCAFCIFNFFSISVGTVAVMYEHHLLLWVYTLCNFLWPLFFVKDVIPRVQSLIAVVSDDDDEPEEKIPSAVDECLPLKKNLELMVM